LFTALVTGWNMTTTRSGFFKILLLDIHNVFTLYYKWRHLGRLNGDAKLLFQGREAPAHAKCNRTQFGTGGFLTVFLWLFSKAI